VIALNALRWARAAVQDRPASAVASPAPVAPCPAAPSPPESAPVVPPRVSTARGSQAPGSQAAPPPRALPPRKARHRDECTTLEQLPNIGHAMAADLRLLGIDHPRELTGREPLELFHELARRSGSRQDPCVLDTLMAAVDFMGGADARPWWHYTAQRKQQHPRL
jgi:hypothetical protein